MLIPPSDIGFIEVGQEISIRYDAFPFEKYGQAKGYITSISKTTVNPSELLEIGGVSIKDNVSSVFYLVDVSIENQYFSVDGSKKTLDTGMTLNADVILENRKLYQWLLEPLISLRKGIINFMSILANPRLDFWHSNNTVPVILQSESSECGLACIAIILNYYGYETNLLSLRKRFSVSLKGSTLSDLIDMSQELNLIGRPVQLELEELEELKCPCILHWDLNHFVVLQKVSGKKITIVDPAMGKVSLSLNEASKHFTGIALELKKASNFKKIKDKEKLNIYQLIKGIKGISTNVIALLLVALIIEILSLFNPFLMQWAIDKVIPFNDKNLLTLLVIGFAVVLLVHKFLEFIQSWIVIYFSNNLKLDLETNIFSILIDLPLSFFQKRHLGDIVSRFESIHNIQSVFTSQFITAVLDGIFAILTLVLMLYYSVKLSLIVLITISIYTIIRWLYYQPLKLLNEEKIIFNAKKDSYF